MPRLVNLVILAALLPAIGIGAGLGRAGVIEIEGGMRLYIRPAPEAIIQAGPIGGPYGSSPFIGGEPFTIEFVACCVDDPTGGTITAIHWDFSYDGSTFNEEASGTGPVSHTYPDGPAQETVALRLTSTSGVQGLVTTLVSVVNIPPTAIIGGPYGGVAGSPVAFSGSALDPSSADTAAGFIYEWDFDYDGAFVANQSGPSLTSPTHTYASAGTYTAALRVTDKDGGVSIVATCTVTISPASVTVTRSATADSWVGQDTSTTNYGTLATMDVQSRSVSKNRRSLATFDLSGIPSNAIILSATMSLYASTVPGDTRTYGIYRVTASWNEMSVTWATLPTTSAIYTGTTTTPGSVNWMSWNVSSDVQTMVSGAATNYGWLLKDNSEDSSTAYLAQFNTREHATVSLRPKLVVTYQLP